MKIKALGASGSGAYGHKSPAFLVDELLLLDAGTVAGELSIREENLLRYILLTHAHLDHLKGIPFLLENLASRETVAPITIAGGKEILG
ncbi:MAG: MBL fold metallo-hydrolase, partial [Syntrophorhabdaceae bacterium]|nr:MBL fold metallo-hydrolase [Syntrophorhabdaceae bacterium]